MQPEVLSYHRSDPSMAIPRQVIAIAWLFIAFGILSLAHMVWHALHMKVFFDFSVLGIFIGRGLLRRSNGWRQFAVAIHLLLTTLLALGAAIFSITQSGGRASVAIGTSSINGITAYVVVLMFCIGLLALNVWSAYWLLKPRVLRLFLPERTTSESEKSRIAAALDVVQLD